VTKPLFIPMAWSSTPDGFGTSRRMRWRDDRGLSEKDLDWLALAKIQHEWAWRVHNALARVDMSVKEYAEREGLNYWRVLRLLNGQIVLRLEDVLRVERSLEVQLFSELRLGSQAVD
jgi:hypothetical protein